MNKQELIDKLTMLAKDFDKSADFCAMIYDDGASAYRECWSKLDDLIKDVKENLSENPYIEDEDLFWEVQQEMNKICWRYNHAGDDWGGIYIEFSVDTTIWGEEVEVFKIYSTQCQSLRPLLEYFRNEDENIDEKLWDKFVIAYKQENCGV